MAGFELKEGFYIDKNVSEDEMWSIFTSLFSSQTAVTTSYKYGFLKALIDNLYNVDQNLTLTFDQVFSSFGEIYWNLILKHNLKQQSKKESELEKILYSIKNEYNIPENITYENLPESVLLLLNHQVKMKCKKYVIGALFVDTKELLYSFSKKTERISFNPRLYEFICKHKIAIEKLNYFEWARFLEKVNSENDVNHLLSKIDESAKRYNLSYYRDILFEEFENVCFYCNKKITKNKVQVDHFIPWSFIKEDNLWNFVLSCPNCNVRKNDRLAGKHYLDEIIVRNERIELNKYSDMKMYQSNRLISIYNWAMVNGYDNIWNP